MADKKLFDWRNDPDLSKHRLIETIELSSDGAMHRTIHDSDLPPLPSELSDAPRKFALTYPAEFSREAIAAVEAKLATELRQCQQGIQFRQFWEYPGCPPYSGPPEETLVRHCIMSVSLVYAREAIGLGEQHAMAVERVRAEVKEGLRMITLAFVKTIHKFRFWVGASGRLDSSVRQEFEKMADWEQIEEEISLLPAVAHTEDIVEVAAPGMRAFSTESGAQKPASSTVPDDGAKKPRGRPPISDVLKLAAKHCKESGGTNKDAAKILYAVTYPTDGQVRSVTTILRYFEKSRSKSSPQPHKIKG